MFLLRHVLMGGGGLLLMNVHMCGEKQENAKQVKEPLLKPCVWGSAMQPWVPGRGDGDFASLRVGTGFQSRGEVTKI